MSHRDKIILKKVISEIDSGDKRIGSTERNEFLNNEMLKRAISMTVINIGELIKNLTDDTRNAYPDIPWKAIAGMRDLTTHKYQTLRMEDVYITAKNEFPELKQKITEILQLLNNKKQ